MVKALEVFSGSTPLVQAAEFTAYLRSQMGIRSDVGFAIKTEAYEKLKNSPHKEAVDAVIGMAEQTLQKDEGFLFVFRYVKWYRDQYSELLEFFDEGADDVCYCSPALDYFECGPDFGGAGRKDC